MGCRRRERGCRRVRPKSVAEQQCSSNEMLSLPPLHAEAADALAELPAHTLRHLVKGKNYLQRTSFFKFGHKYWQVCSIFDLTTSIRRLSPNASFFCLFFSFEASNNLVLIHTRLHICTRNVHIILV